MDKNGPINTPETPRKAVELLLQLMRKAGEHEVPDDFGSVEEAQRAYRKVAARFHPDKAPDNPHADRYMAQANLAWSLLETHDKEDGTWPVPAPSEPAAGAAAIVGPGVPVGTGRHVAHDASGVQVVVDVVDVDVDFLFNDLVRSAGMFMHQLPEGLLNKIMQMVGMPVPGSPRTYPGATAPRFVFGQNQPMPMPHPAASMSPGPTAHAGPPVRALPVPHAAPSVHGVWVCPDCGQAVQANTYHDCKTTVAGPHGAQPQSPAISPYDPHHNPQHSYGPGVPQTDQTPYPQQQAYPQHQQPTYPQQIYPGAPAPQTPHPAQAGQYPTGQIPQSPAVPAAAAQAPPAAAPASPAPPQPPPAPRHAFVVQWHEVERWANETSNGSSQGTIYGQSVGPNGQASAAGKFIAWTENGQFTVQGTPHRLVPAQHGSAPAQPSASG